MSGYLKFVSIILLLVSINPYFVLCLVVPEVDQVKAPTEDEEKFIKNPASFLGQNAVTTWILSKPGQHPGNGEQREFGLRRTPADSTGFELYLKQAGDDGILSWWLTTKETVDIDFSTGPIFLSTPELQGCILYVKRNSVNNLHVYHHYREGGCPAGTKDVISNATGHYVFNEDTGNVDCYDDMLAIEGYFHWDPNGEFLCPIAGQQKLRFGVTAFIYYNKPTDELRFVYMGYCFDIDNNGVQVKLQKYNTNQRPIKAKTCTDRATAA